MGYLLNNIERLEKEDFNNPELYQELLQIENGLEREIKTNKLSERAKELRIKREFERTLTSVKRELRNRSLSIGSEDTNVTAFTLLDNGITLPPSIADDMKHIPGQLNCGSWICGDDGIKVFTEKGMVTICPHPIIPIRILRNLETGKYKVEIVFYLRGQTQTIFVSREVLASPSKILELAAYAVIIKARTAPLFCEYFADMETYNPEILREFASTSKLGWVKHQDELYFIPYDKEIVYDSESEFKALYSSIKTKGSREKWYSCVKEIRERKNPAFLLNLAACFASVLAKPCDTLPFIVSLWGRTGIGKSVLLKVCASVWADPDEGKFISDPKATATAMEMRLDALNNLPMLMDDMAQITKRGDDYSELIYNWCSKNGKMRSNKNLGLNKSTSWSNCTLTNGERPIVDDFTQGGAINRVIDIECNELMFDGESGRKTIKVVSKNYGFAGEEFVDVIKSIGFDEVNRLYGKYYNDIRATAKEQGIEKEDKQAMAMALILVADHLIEKHLFDDGITIDIGVAISYLRNKGEISETENTYKKILDEITIHSNNFADNLDEPKIEGHEFWGVWVDPTHVGIIPTVFKRIIEEKSLEKPFLSWAKSNGILQTDAGKNQKTVRYRGNPMKLYVIGTRYGEEPEEDDDFKELPFD